MLTFIIWISRFMQDVFPLLCCALCLWMRIWAHTVPVCCQQSDCEGQSLTTGSSDKSPQINNIFDQNHMMNIIHLIDQTRYHWVSCQDCVRVTKNVFMYMICVKHIMLVFCGSGNDKLFASLVYEYMKGKWLPFASFSRGTLWVIL